MRDVISAYEKKAIIFLICSGIIGLVVLAQKSKKAPLPSEIKIVYPESPAGGESRASFKGVMIHIDGAVERPGVYKMNEGDRLIDLVNKAGLQKQADSLAVNLARKLKDQEKIIIPSRGENSGSAITFRDADASGSSDDSQTKININAADRAQLMDLAGVGEKLADSIIRYREEHGAFGRLEDLNLVPGIGEKKWESIKENISLD